MKIENELHMKTYALHLLSCVGSRLKIARERRGLSVSKMAEISFCDESVIEKIENGDENIGLLDVIKVLTSLYLDEDVHGLACPGDDEVGLFLAKYFGKSGVEDPDKYNF